MSSVAPPPSPALLRRALGDWRRDRRGLVAAAVVLVLAGTVLAVVAGSEPTTEDGPGLRELATAAVTAAALTTVLLTLIAHLGAARLRWFGHLARFPRLLTAALRLPGGGAPRALAGFAGGVVLATFVHPVLGLATAALAIAVLPTDVGLAAAVWRTTGHAARAKVAGHPVAADPDRWRLTMLTGAFGLAPVALLRLLVLEPGCTLDRVLGAGCPDGVVAISATAVAVAIGAVAVTPLALGLGDVLARSLAGESFGAPTPDLADHVDERTRPAPPAEPAAAPAEDDVAEVADEPPADEDPVLEDPALEALARRALALRELSFDEAPAEPETPEEPEDGPQPLAVEEAAEPEDEPAALAAEVPALWPDDRPVAAPDADGDADEDDDEGEPTVEIPPVRPAPPSSAGRPGRISEPWSDPPGAGTDAAQDEPPEPEPRPRPVPAATTDPELPDLFATPADRVETGLDAAIARARPALESLTPGTRSAAVLLFSSLTDGVVDAGADPIEELRRSLHAAPLETTRSTLSLVRANAGRLDALRSQYQRSPRIARGAIERAASVGLRSAGLPGEQAEALAETLLDLDAEDWGHLTAALEALDDELDRA